MRCCFSEKRVLTTMRAYLNHYSRYRQAVNAIVKSTFPNLRHSFCRPGLLIRRLVQHSISKRPFLVSKPTWHSWRPKIHMDPQIFLQICLRVGMNVLCLQFHVDRIRSGLSGWARVWFWVENGQNRVHLRTLVHEFPTDSDDP